MSLRIFHIFFITVSIILCIGFGWWSLGKTEAAGYYLGLGVISLASAVALVIYSGRFLEKSIGLISMIYKPVKYLKQLVAACMLISAHPLAACSLCFGNVTGKMASAVSLAVVFMLVITGTVLCGFAGFFIYLWKRAKAHSQENL